MLFKQNIKPIKVLHIITGLDTGGAETMLYKLLSHMSEDQFENRVVSLIPSGNVGAKIVSLGINVDVLGLKRGAISPIALIKLVRIIREYDPDIIQTWLYHADLLGFLMAKLTGKHNLIWNIRCSDMDLRMYKRLTAWTINACAFYSKHPAFIITNSNMAKEYHIEKLGYNKEKFYIIPNGFDLDQFKPDKDAGMRIRNELGINTDALIVGLVSRYDPMKDHKSFLKAAAIVLQHIPDIYFILVGHQVDKANLELIHLVKQLGLDNRVYLLGERNDIPDIMNALDLFCSSSSFGEGFPNVIGEAMACSVPCVVTHVGHSSEIVKNTGVIVAPRDFEALAQGMIKLFLMPEDERIKLGQSARKRIEKKFSIDQIVRQYEELYFKVAGQDNFRSTSSQK